MPRWEWIGTRIPKPVLTSGFLRSVGFCEKKGGIRWEKMSPHSAGWAAFDASRDDRHTLLVIHGTGQRVRDGFHGLRSDEFERLNRSYEGRILAFEHPAIRNMLERNVFDLLRNVPDEIRLSLDVIGISRGGLMARYLAEGWASGFHRAERVQIKRLLFVGTPNAGTPSARRGVFNVDWEVMTAWRGDVRRVGLVNQDDRSVGRVPDPMAIEGLVDLERVYPRWPVLFGTCDQLPNSPVLRLLNGFVRAAPRLPNTPRYYAISSSFNFQHGVPDPLLIQRGSSLTRSQVMAKVVPVANDLVVPTRGVYDPPQGPFSSGLFPIVPTRLMVLGPASNVTHVGFFRSAAVRHQILQWLDVD